MLIEAACAGTHDAAGVWTHDVASVRHHPWRRRDTSVRIGDADHGVIIRRRRARLESLQNGPATLAGTGAHAALGVDADQLDPGRDFERSGRFVGKRELEEVARDRRGGMTAARASAEIARLVVADIDADHEVRREA